MTREIFTIGHSMRPIKDFIALLKAHEIKGVVDVRSIPRSRHNPQYEQEALRTSLSNAHIGYRCMKSLGGRRHTNKASLNTGWKNVSFRGYADYMATDEFAHALGQLEEIGSKKRSAIMCAEAVPWRCHRSLIADALTKKKWIVRDISSRVTAKRQVLTSFLKVRGGRLVYP